MDQGWINDIVSNRFERVGQAFDIRNADGVTMSDNVVE